MKAIAARATMSPLVRRLLREGHKVVWLANGRIKIGEHFFRLGKRVHVVR